MSREQWRQAEHDRRTADSVRALDDSSTGAHGYGDHGAQTTNPQHSTRVQTGVTPSGRNGPKVGRATRFDTPELQLEANGRARRLMNRDAPTTPTTRVNAHGTTMPNDVGYVVEGPRGGYGSDVEVQRGPANPTTGQPGAPLPGRPTQASPQQPRAQVYYRYNETTGQWRPRTSYPTDLPPIH